MVRRPRAGFTLVELLAVMLLIAILLGIILGAALYLIKTARSNRSQHTATTLKTALVNYRHEYGRWPVPGGWASSAHFKTNGAGDQTMTATGDDNKMVFDLLRTDNSDANANPKGIPFLDETAVLALAGGQRMTYHMARARTQPPYSLSFPFPLVYTMRNGGTEYFSVTVNFDQETAAVGRPRDD
jgi:prepilin-type N-terminal cleavage/methylation domain-containing protein